MLLVAFSRRMCCSRVCSASRNAVRPLRVDRHADEPARQRAPVLVARREVRRRAGRRSRAARRSAATCRPRRRRPSRPAGRRSVSASRSAATHTSAPLRVRPLDHRARGRAAGRSLPGYCTSTPKQPSNVAVAVRVADHDLDAERLGARAHDVDRLRVAVGVDEEHVAAVARSARCSIAIASAAAVPSSSSDAFASSMPVRSLTIVWKLSERFEPALADLGLVRRVRGVPGRVLEHVAQDHGRRDRVVVAEPDQRREHLVAVGERAQLRERVGLRQRASSASGTSLADRPRHRGVDERVERRRTRASASIVAWSVASRTDVPVGELASIAGVSRSAGSVDGSRRTRLPLCRGPERFAPARRSGADAFPVGEVPRPRRDLLSRVASLRRFGCLRDSGEWLLLRRPARIPGMRGRAVRTLPSEVDGVCATDR